MRFLRLPRALALAVAIGALAVGAAPAAAASGGSITTLYPLFPSYLVAEVVGSDHTVTATATSSDGTPLEGVSVYFTVAGVVTTSGTCVTDTAGQCSFTYGGALTIGDDIVTAWADANSNGVQDANEIAGTAPVRWLADVPGSTTVITPAAAQEPVPGSHDVTFTVTYAGTPLVGVQVFYFQDGVNHSSDSCGTDANGQCFTIFGSDLPGLDTLTAWADSNGNGIEDPGELLGTATVLWGPPVSNGKATGGGKAGGVTFSFTADAKNGPKGNCNVSDKTTKVDCTSVDSIVVTGSHATITGQATVNGVATTYTIDVDDNGDPGVGKDTFQIQTGTGYAAGGTITAGNVQVHK